MNNLSSKIHEELEKNIDSKINDYYISTKIYSSNINNFERVKDYRNKNIAFYGFFSNRDLNLINLFFMLFANF